MSGTSRIVQRPVSRLAAILALLALALVSSATVADARGGRTTAADCAAGSDDPDCPDTGKK
jgi:hypothetical protein